MLRPPPDVSLYHRHSNPLFPQTLQHLGRLENVHAVVLPRTEEQRDYVRSLALPSVIVPEEAVDAQSLIALADLVVSAGGTMNREAAALGVPVYTTYGGRLGGVDEALIRDGRLRPLTDPRALELGEARPGNGSACAAIRPRCCAAALGPDAGRWRSKAADAEHPCRALPVRARSSSAAERASSRSATRRSDEDGEDNAENQRRRAAQHGEAASARTSSDSLRMSSRVPHAAPRVTAVLSSAGGSRPNGSDDPHREPPL